MNDRFKFRVWLEYAKLYYGLDSFYYDRLKNKYTLHFEDGYTKTIKEKDCVIEQCTGIKDKNGKLIYEGDVLQLIDQQIDYIVGVYWNKGMFCYEITPNSANLVFSDLSDNETEVTIIGNIHENGDLIE